MIGSVRSSFNTSGRIAAALIGAALIACCQSSGGAFAQSSGPLNANACRVAPDPYYRSDRPRALIHIDGINNRAELEEVRTRCGALVNDTSLPARDLRNAIYYYAAASRRLVALDLNTQFTPATLTSDARGRLQDPEEKLLRAIALDPDFSYARLELARIYRLQRRHDAALEQLERIQRSALDPSDPVHAAAHFIRAALFIDDHHNDFDLALPTAQTGRPGAAPTLSWESALTDLSVFTDAAQGADAQHHRREHPDRVLALTWLADYGRRLACLYQSCDPAVPPEVWDTRPYTRENTQRAIDYLTRAQAAVDVLRSLYPADAETRRRYVATYSELGAARTLMAGLQGEAGVAAFGCAPGLGNAALLAQAETDLQRATPGEDISVAHEGVRDALVRLACVRLAQGQTERAYGNAEEALRGDPAPSAANAAHYLMRGRIRVVQRDRPGAVSDFARAAEGFAVGAPAPTPSDPCPGQARRARALAHLARARARFVGAAIPLTSAPGELAQILSQDPDAITQLTRDLADAVACDPANWGAAVDYGKLRYDQRDFTAAYNLLRTFEFLNEGAEHAPRAVRAEGLLYLSKVETVSETYANANHAIRHADEALSLNGAWPYREQACLARLRFNRVAFTESGPRAVCSALEGSPAPEASLVEGMYHLRRAFVVRGGERIREWEDAYRAFTTGLSALENTQQPDALLRARLLYGQGTAQYCIGFAEIGSQTINGIEGGHAGSEAYFAQYNVNTCPPRR